MSSAFKWGIITLVKQKKLTNTERKLKKLLALNIAKRLESATQKRSGRTEQATEKQVERVA